MLPDRRDGRRVRTAEAASAGALDYRRVWWFCAAPALQRKIADLVDRERLDDFVGVWPLPSRRAALRPHS